MKRLLVGLTVLVTAGVTSGFGLGTAAADPPPPPPPVPLPGAGTPATGPNATAFALGGAHVLGIPYDEYIRQTGQHWFPGMIRTKVDYPAGQVQGHTLERFFPGIGAIGERIRPGLGLDGPDIGYSVDVGEQTLYDAMTAGRPGTAMGLSEGALVVDAVKNRLAFDPAAPPTDQIRFATFGDPMDKSPWTEGFLPQIFPVGSVVPFMDYRIPPRIDSQYDTDQFISPYDSVADFPDRPDNIFALTNTLAGLATGHTAIAFTSPKNIPARNVIKEVNSRGGTTTTYMVPEQHLPLVMGAKYLGYDEDTLNKLDAILKPRIDRAYSRNDDPATAPITVDPKNGFDPIAVTAPANDATFTDKNDPLQELANGVLSMFSPKR